MDKIEKIRQEIERMKRNAESAKKEWNDGNYNQNAFAEDCRISSFNHLLSFLDTLSEEPDKSLEEAAEKYSDKYCSDWAYRLEYEDAFIAGAEWMEKEINKELIKAMEKVHEMRDVDYDIHVDTSTDGSFNRLNIIQNEK